MKQNSDKYFFYTIACCSSLVLIKIISLYLVHIPLWVDEAQYWTWSKELNFGYYSKPPFIAALIDLTTKLFGDSEFGVRIGAPFLHLFTSILVFFIAKELCDKRTALFSAITYITLPAVSISSGFISTDAPLMFFWAAAFYTLIRATKTPEKNYIWWLLYAVSVGLGLMSKYTMAAFVICSFYYIFVTRKKQAFTKPDFWIANVIAFLIFLPNLYWNYNNHFVSFVHTQENVVSGKAANGIKFKEFIEFFTSQIIVFGAAFICFLTIFFKKEAYVSNSKILALFSLPLLFAGMAISLISGAQAHWAAPCYIALSIFVIDFILKNNKEKWLKIILISNLIIFVLLLDIKIPAAIASIKKDPLKRITMWYEAEKPLRDAINLYPNATIVADERKTIATMMYALRDGAGNPKIIYKWNPKGLTRDHYDITKTFADTSENPIILVSRGDGAEELSEIYFNIDRLSVPDENSPFYLFLLKGRR